MSFIDELLWYAYDMQTVRRGILWGLGEPVSNKFRRLKERAKLRGVKETTLRVTLGRLRERGLLENIERGVWRITPQGKAYCERKLKHAERAKYSATERNLIVAFDVPEKEKRKRNWLRSELVGLGFEQLQKSVWFGPGPLPEDFIRDAGERDLLPHLKFFEVREKEIV